MLARETVAVLVSTCFGAWSANADAETASSPQSTGVSLLSTSGLISRTDSESTMVQSLGISYAVTDAVSVSLRYGAVHHSGGGQPSGTGLGNLVATGSMTKSIGEYLQLSGGLATTLPTNAIGTGTMEEARFAAEISAIDWFGTMFLPNYLDIAPGAGASLTLARVTARVQIDVHEVIRVRAERVDAFDAAATALVPDVSLSYRVISPLSLSAHVTEIRLLTTPSSVHANPSLRTEHFVSGGASIDVQVGGAKTLTGTLTYARPIDGPLAPQRYQAIALDVALAL
jgi:hypothetical protein